MTHKTFAHAVALTREVAQDDSGQDLVEYAFLITFIALAVTGVLIATQAQIAGVFSRLVAVVDAAS